MKMSEMDSAMTEGGWRPTRLWTPVMICLMTLMVVKLLCVAVIAEGAGCLAGFGVYVYAVWAAFVLNVPEGIFRMRWVQAAVMLAVDVAVISLYAAHPAAWVLPSLSLAGSLACLRLRDSDCVPTPGMIQYCGYIGVWSVIAAAVYFAG